MYLNQVPQRVLPLLDYVAMPHPVAGNVPLPVNGVEILILPNARYIILHIRGTIEGECS